MLKYVVGFIIFFFLCYAACIRYLMCQDNKLLCLPRKLDIINLGSTNAYYDISYDNFKLKGGNLANIPQYLEDDRLLLCKYGKRIKEGGKALIVFQEFVFEVRGDIQKNKKNRVYYEALCWWEINDFSIRVWLHHLAGAMTEPFTHARRKAREKWKGYVATSEEKRIHLQGRMRDWENNIGIFGFKSDEIPEHMAAVIENNKEIVLEMIDICRKMKIEPILIILPMSEIFWREISSECMEVCLRKPVNEIVRKTGVRLYDYSNVEELQKEELYMNSDCLNTEGQAKLMKMLIQDVYHNEDLYSECTLE